MVKVGVEQLEQLQLQNQEQQEQLRLQNQERKLLLKKIQMLRVGVRVKEGGEI